jgi:hypothetical protein
VTTSDLPPAPRPPNDRTGSPDGAALTAACSNCGDATPGNYCPHCGQRRALRIISMRRLISEAIEDQLSLNAALPRTVGLLVGRPGRLTADYLNGRIARYIPPFRLYLITSFIFFFAFSLTRSGGTGTFRLDGDADQDAPIAASTEGLEVPDLPFLTPGLNARFRQRVERMAELRPGELDRALQQEIVRRAPFIIFLLLPFFAAVLKLLYRRRYYVEHMIFAVHLQTFAFMIFTAVLLVDAVPLLARLLLLWVPVYVVMAMKHVYRQSVPKTLLKFAALGAVYLVGFGISMVSLILFALLTMPL